MPAYRHGVGMRGRIDDLPSLTVIPEMRQRDVTFDGWPRFRRNKPESRGAKVAATARPKSPKWDSRLQAAFHGANWHIDTVYPLCAFGHIDALL